MSHFAKVLDGKVIQVIVAEPEFFQTYKDTSPGQWIQTSYNTKAGVHRDGGVPLRKNFAAIGYSYDHVLDAFIPPKPYPSWVLNETTCRYEAPIPKPQDMINAKWNEEAQEWYSEE